MKDTTHLSYPTTFQKSRSLITITQCSWWCQQFFLKVGKLHKIIPFLQWRYLLLDLLRNNCFNNLALTPEDCFKKAPKLWKSKVVYGKVILSSLPHEKHRTPWNFIKDKYYFIKDWWLYPINDVTVWKDLTRNLHCLCMIASHTYDAKCQLVLYLKLKFWQIASGIKVGYL